MVDPNGQVPILVAGLLAGGVIIGGAIVAWFATKGAAAFNHLGAQRLMNLELNDEARLRRGRGVIENVAWGEVGTGRTEDMAEWIYDRLGPVIGAYTRVSFNKVNIHWRIMKREGHCIWVKYWLAVSFIVEVRGKKRVQWYYPEHAEWTDRFPVR
jgi:hypothetical protein